MTRIWREVAIWTSILLFSILSSTQIRVGSRLIDDGGEEETGDRLITEKVGEVAGTQPLPVALSKMSTSMFRKREIEILTRLSAQIVDALLQRSRASEPVKRSARHTANALSIKLQQQRTAYSLIQLLSNPSLHGTNEIRRRYKNFLNKRSCQRCDTVKREASRSLLLHRSYQSRTMKRPR